MASSRRIASIDIVRGLVMALMMIDHVREFFFLHRQVTDPVNLADSGLALFFTRAASHICAPAFVLLAGLAVALRRHRRGDSAASTARYLIQRGLILVLLEVTVVNFAWKFEIPPMIVYLQVIWAIGLSMIALAGLIFLPPGVLLTASLLIVGGHNLLDSFAPKVDSVGTFLWSVLHERSRVALGNRFVVRVSYPVLPWIGVIGLGYALGRLYVGDRAARTRRLILLAAGAGCVLLFQVLRPLNIYGEKGLFVAGDSAIATVASLLNTTKYPPSLLFLLMTLGPTLILLALAEHLRGRLPSLLARLGTMPMTYYVLHLYALHLVNRAVALATGTSGLYHFDRIGFVWLATFGFLAVVASLTIRLDGLRRRLTGVRRPQEVPAEVAA